MTLHNIPCLTPDPPQWPRPTDQTVVSDPARRQPRGRLARAQDVLALPLTVLEPGAVLDDEDVVMPYAGAVVFVPDEPFRNRLNFNKAQQRQMFVIYCQLPHGTKGLWRNRHGICQSKIHRWGKRLGFASVTQQKRNAVQTGGNAPVPTVLDGFDIVSLVHQYVERPYGEKQAFLEKHGIERVTMMRWIRRIEDGTLARYLHQEGFGNDRKR